MMNFVDISNWQEGLDVWAIPVDAVICKATEGTTFVDHTCDGFISAAAGRGLRWGFYHFASNGNPTTEADFFVDNTINYFGKGIPVLDWETTQDVAWVNSFVNRVHERTGVWPWIYGNPWRFNQGGVEGNCARWVASYPMHLLNPDFNVDEGEPPVVDGNLVAWQFASDGRISGAGGRDLDMNRFYGSVSQWDAYAQGDNAPKPEPMPEPQPEPEKPASPGTNLTADEIAEAVANKIAARLKD